MVGDNARFASRVLAFADDYDIRLSSRSRNSAAGSEGTGLWPCRPNGHSGNVTTRSGRTTFGGQSPAPIFG
jgi:hypothetical protein